MSSTNLKFILRIFGFILSLILTIGGVMLMRRQDFTVGLIMLAGALALFFYSSRSIETTSFKEEDFSGIKPYLVPGLLFLIAFVLSGLLIFNVTYPLRTDSLNYQATAEWILSIVSLSAGVLVVAKWKPASPRNILEWIKANKIEVILVSVVVLIGLFLRMLFLTDHPYPWSGDEASVGLEAVRLLTGDNTNWFDAGWSGQPNVSFLPTTLTIIIFGQTMFAVKMMSVLVGTLSILAVYLLAREWFSMEIGLLASAFLAVFPFHLQFSRIGVDNIVDSLMAPLVLWLVFRAVRVKSLPAFLLTGIAAGLTFYLYVGTRLVLILAFGALAFIAFRQRDFLKSHLTQLGVFLASILVTINPIGVFFLRHPEHFMTRIGQEGILLNGWLGAQVAETGKSAFQILFQQFSTTVLVFFSQNAGSNFLNFDRPYLTALGAAFFMIGLVWSISKIWERPHFVLQMWFWSVVVLGGMLTLSPPANTRLVMTTGATAMFFGLGVWQVADVLLKLKFKPVLVYGLSIVLLAAISADNLSFYFGHYREGRLFQDANAELGMEIGLHLKRVGEDYVLYLMGEPRVFAHFPTTDFVAPDNEKQDLRVGDLPEFTLDPSRGALFAAIPENQMLLDEIIKKYPGGTEESVLRLMSDEVLYYAYILPPSK